MIRYYLWSVHTVQTTAHISTPQAVNELEEYYSYDEGDVDGGRLENMK